MRVLVLGGYGLIGQAITRHLLQDGFEVTGLGRSARRGAALLPQANWIGADMAQLTRPDDWQTHLAGIDAVVNAAGVLQNGLTDRVAATQRDSILALIAACEAQGMSRFVQISAPGVARDASTLFFRTKAVADEALAASSLQWTIFRPGLVISPHAYGGTSLVRTLAAFPLVQPLVLGDSMIQTVPVGHVAEAVSLALQQDLSGQDFDLVEAEPHSLRALVLSFRSWLGFPAPRAVLALPAWMGQLTARAADAAGWLGWRSALRSAALAVLAHGVRGDPGPWRTASGRMPARLEQTLDDLPSTAQERIYARAMLVFPVLLVLLAAFWVVSGLIGLVRHEAAVSVIGHAMPEPLAGLFVRAGSVIDIAIGLGLLFRSVVRIACFASIGVSVAYLAGSLWFAPHLWADPLGPMIKVFPAIGLALIVAALAEAR